RGRRRHRPERGRCPRCCIRGRGPTPARRGGAATSCLPPFGFSAFRAALSTLQSARKDPYPEKSLLIGGTGQKISPAPIRRAPTADRVDSQLAGELQRHHLLGRVLVVEGEVDVRPVDG